MSEHERKVQEIASDIKSFYHRKEPYRIFHGSTNSTRPAPRDRVIDISALNTILSIDTKTQTVILEPNVPMDTLVRATLEHGLIPPVVMEFPGITVGGGFAGSAGESSSFKFGYFDQSIISIEMVLANGEIVTASKTERPDLFKCAAGSLGTLGTVTQLEVQLIKAKNYVKTTYNRCHNVRDTIESVQREIDNPEHDYVDGIILSSTHGVVITGQLTDKTPKDAVVCKFSRPWDPWYYLHVKERTISEGLSIKLEYVPISDYLFRYDRGGFWVGAAAFKYFGFVPFNRLTRWLLDDFMHTRMLYRALHGGKMYTQQITQDLSLPYSTAEKFIEYTAEEFGIWPLWLCPLGAVNPPTFHPTTTLPGPDNSAKPMLNIGLWGAASTDIKTFVAQNRRSESKLTQLGGRKVLYSQTFYTEEEFWDLYDKDAYQDLRNAYSATTLPTVYDKVKTDVAGLLEKRTSLFERITTSWPLAGFIGIFHAIRSEDYLLHRDSLWMHIRKKFRQSSSGRFSGRS